MRTMALLSLAMLTACETTGEPKTPADIKPDSYDGDTPTVRGPVRNPYEAARQEDTSMRRALSKAGGDQEPTFVRKNASWKMTITYPDKEEKVFFASNEMVVPLRDTRWKCSIAGAERKVFEGGGRSESVTMTCLNGKQAFVTYASCQYWQSIDKFVGGTVYSVIDEEKHHVITFQCD